VDHGPTAVVRTNRQARARGHHGLNLDAEPDGLGATSAGLLAVFIMFTLLLLS
jgi:hypothetical protein